MARLLNMFEFRLGASLENSQAILGGAFSLLFDVGLMNYRFDSGFKWEQVYGLVYNVGLSVIF